MVIVITKIITVIMIVGENNVKKNTREKSFSVTNTMLIK